MIIQPWYKRTGMPYISNMEAFTLPPPWLTSQRWAGGRHGQIATSEGRAIQASLTRPRSLTEFILKCCSSRKTLQWFSVQSCWCLAERCSQFMTNCMMLSKTAQCALQRMQQITAQPRMLHR